MLCLCCRGSAHILRRSCADWNVLYGCRLFVSVLAHAGYLDHEEDRTLARSAAKERRQRIRPQKHALWDWEGRLCQGRLGRNTCLWSVRSHRDHVVLGTFGSAVPDATPCTLQEKHGTSVIQRCPYYVHSWLAWKQHCPHELCLFLQPLEALHLCKLNLPIFTDSNCLNLSGTATNICKQL